MPYSAQPGRSTRVIKHLIWISPSLKCTGMDEAFQKSHGLVPIVKKSFKDNCPNISTEQKTSYLSNNMKPNEPTNLESCDEDNGQKHQKCNQSVKPYFQPFLNQKTLELDVLLVKSIISSSLTFLYFENPYSLSVRRSMICSPEISLSIGNQQQYCL
ncbi:hypothetical protein MJO29_007021 [Puccinia striiformis f. sp. tritici]|nr:hypothetical protein MJO29_007021 [Puccinia striiformis f. sp. tritici]